jgi:uncharacterized protein
MSKKIIITGATGLIGKKLSSALIKRGDEVIIFSRNIDKAKQIIPGARDYIEWNYHQKEKWQNALNDKDAVIHLAGANLFGKRWNEEYKNKILESRKLSTHNLIEAIKESSSKPKVFICSSAIGYFGNCGETELAEESEAGKDFLANVCKIWEDEAAKVEELGVRRVSVRTGIVLSPEEGALKQMLLPFYFFVGGPLGNGRQWLPWIHIDDIVQIYLFTLDNTEIKKSVNAASPNPVRMKEFAKTLGKVLKRPSLFTVSEFMLKLAVGEAAETITSSAKVIPKKLLASDYKFKFEKLRSALEDLL